jgi:TP901 family phage tail tape measure protein
MANKISFVVIAKDAFSSVSQKVSLSTKRMTKTFDSLGSKLKVVSSKFGALATAALGFVGIRKFFSQGIKFQDSMADLASITGSTGKELKFYSDESLRLSKKANISAAEIAMAFKLVASAKAELLKDPKALSNITEQTLLLANASGISLAESAQIVTESLNQFGASAKETARFVNVLAAGSKFGASEVAQTGVAVVRAGVAAKFAGVGFEKVNAVLQVLSLQGEKGQRAGTALRSVFLRLESLSKKFDKLKPSVVGLDTALENLHKRNLSTKKKTELFGQMAVAVGSMMVDSREKIKEMNSSISDTSIASQQAGIRLGTLGSKIKAVEIAINNALIKTFLKLSESDVFEKIADDTVKWIESFDEKDMEQVAESIKDIAAAMQLLGQSFAFGSSKILTVKDLLLDVGDALFGIDDGFERIRKRFAGKSGVDVNKPIFSDDVYHVTGRDHITSGRELKLFYMNRRKQAAMDKKLNDKLISMGLPLDFFPEHVSRPMREIMSLTKEMKVHLDINISNESNSKVHTMVTSEEDNDFNIGVNMVPYSL